LGDFTQFFHGFEDRVINDVALDAQLLGDFLRGLAVEFDQFEDQVCPRGNLRVEGGEQSSEQRTAESIFLHGGMPGKRGVDFLFLERFGIQGGQLGRFSDVGTDEIYDTSLAERGEELAESPFGGIEGCVPTEEGFKNGEDNILKIRRGNIVPVMPFEGSQHADVHRVVVEIEELLP